MRTHPCVGRCSLSFGGDLCRGCGRTIDEVRDWNSYTSEVKAALMRELPDRLDRFLAAADFAAAEPSLS